MASSGMLRCVDLVRTLQDDSSNKTMKCNKKTNRRTAVERSARPTGSVSDAGGSVSTW
jgi:hypothetical protein